MTLNYDREMIELVREIKRHVPIDLKSSIKLANPSLLSELRALYLSTDEVVLKALIKEVFVKAGPEWQLETKNQEPQEPVVKPTSKKMYRGHPVINETAPQKNTSAPKNDVNKPKKVRMYRGHPIVD